MEGVLNRAKEYALKEGRVDKLANELYTEYRACDQKAIELVEEKVKSQGFKNLNEYKESFKPEIAKKINAMSDAEMTKFLKENNFPQSYIDKVNSGSTTREKMIDDIANRKVDTEVNPTVRSLIEKDYCGNDMLSDIVDAVFDGSPKNQAGEEVKISYGHGKEYYEGNTVSKRSEIMANYGAIELQPVDSTKRLKQIRETFGDEFADTFYDMHMKTYRRDYPDWYLEMMKKEK